MSLDAGRVVRLYGLVLGAGLLLEGGLLLVFDVLRVALPELSGAIATGDTRHNALHVAWGLVILGLLLTDRGVPRATVVMLVFGVFYTGLAVLGVVMERPFGLQLGPGENVFHFLVGPLALLLGAWSVQARRTQGARSGG